MPKPWPALPKIIMMIINVKTLAVDFGKIA